jgi:LysR family transcriptional regulator, hydrogen peroxide-inducible genes activator
MLSKLNFSLTQLEYVIAVNKYGHFAKAAEACNVTQPTLSMQLQKLEEDLGVKLFDRSKKPILLTEVGRKLIEQFQTILFEAKKIDSLVQTGQGNKTQGHLSLAVIPTIAPYILPRLLPVLEKSFPLLDLEISEMQTERIIEALENDELDVGLLATPLNKPQISEHALYYEPFYVLCRKGHELAQHRKVKYAELKYPDIWLLTEGHCLRNQVLDICSLKQEKLQKKKYRFESGSIETLKSLVDSYGGYTLIPYLATETSGQRTQVVPFERPIPAREVGLVFRRKYYKTELIEVLGESILAAIPEELRKIRPKDLDLLPV